MATRRNLAFLSSTTFADAQTSTLTFSNLSGFQQFTIIGSVKIAAGSTSRILYRFNDSLGNYATFTLNYFASTYTEFGSAAVNQTTYANFGRFTEIISTARPSQEFTTFTLDCMNVSDTSSFPFLTGKSSLGIEGANSFQQSVGQNVSITSAVSSFTLFVTGGTFTTGSKFSIYGRKAT
jgi:hypothetical protein